MRKTLRGMTLAESIVAFAILVLALGMAFTGLSTSAAIMAKANDRFSGYDEASGAVDKAAAMLKKNQTPSDIENSLGVEIVPGTAAVGNSSGNSKALNGYYITAKYSESDGSEKAVVYFALS